MPMRLYRSESWATYSQIAPKLIVSPATFTREIVNKTIKEFEGVYASDKDFFEKPVMSSDSMTIKFADGSRLIVDGNNLGLTLTFVTKEK